MSGRPAPLVATTRGYDDVPDDAPPRTMAAALDRLRDRSRGLTFNADTAATYLSFAEVGELTADLAARWAGLGVGPGDRVVLVADDGYEFALLFLSALRAGVIAVPVHPPYRMGQAEQYGAILRRMVTDSAATCCLVGGSLREVVAGAELSLPVHEPADLRAAAPGAIRAPRPEDTAFLQFSSGTTAAPKAVVVSHRALLANAEAIRAGLRAEPADRAVSWLPLYHDMGLVGFLVVPVINQIATWYQSSLRFARSPIGWLRLISTVGATIAYAPNFAYGLLATRATDADVAALDLSAWRVAGCGAEPVQAHTLRAFAERFAPAGFAGHAFLPSYGLAESTLAVTLTPAGSGLRTTRLDGREIVSCGVPVAGTEVRILGPGGERCGPGVEGEICVRGASLADGYHGRPEETARAWADGWLHTGDQGFLRDGHLYVTGRLKDIILVNGINHHPHDIERVAGTVAGIRAGNIAALPVRNGHSEGVRLVLSLARGADGDQVTEQVRRAVRRELGLSVHDILIVRGDLPKTSSGKLRRARTAELLRTGELVVRS
ncbi:fatty acyl-AMP ligase [Dactylosporangium roseum]|uniref:Fatty acyl-AMP ligase n=1 Tax=Dactylosporangium roseum TaxID=47989 RepID=A0ABY5YY71_9ACTN|nr:fatty acyl-AMP ligase [Dactylosporangium roseum]UWZ34705.1 fatty acyl-AMP ligase [Dactylosporangium roseum]